MNKKTNKPAANYDPDDAYLQDVRAMIQDLIDAGEVEVAHNDAGDEVFSLTEQKVA